MCWATSFFSSRFMNFKSLLGTILSKAPCILGLAGRLAKVETSLEDAENDGAPTVHLR